jgi:NAD(P)-dependent dehydrogenase (short-subunit alcohol dehydrogenase family)
MGPLDRLPIPRRRPVSGADLQRAVSGRTVVVTGASSGIGRATALRLGAAGAHVVLVARRAAELEALATELPEATVCPCDLSDTAATTVLGELLAELGVDVLVSNAGHSIRRTLERSADVAADAERLIVLNYLAPVRLIAALLPSLVERRGQVVCVSSIAAQAGTPGFAAYAASKSALDAFVRSAARERGCRGVAFTTVHMPLVRTAMVAPSADLLADVPSLSPEAAAEILAGAVVHRPRRIGTPAGELAALGWALDPAITTAVDRRLRGAGEGAGAGGAPGSTLRRLARLAVTTNVRR